MTEAALTMLAGRLQALASPPRIRILLALRSGALCVCQLAAILDVPASTVSSHLADLRHAGIVGEHRKGRYVWYTLHRRDDAVPWLRLLARQAGVDPLVMSDLDRAQRFRKVPPESLALSAGCDVVAAGPGRPRARRVRRNEDPTAARLLDLA
jgi:ArsR family transcriptional regulator